MNGKSLVIAIIAIVGLVITLITTLVAGGIYIAGLKARVETLEKARLRPDPWTGKDALFWSVQLKEANPQMKMPTPRHQPDE